MWWCGGVVVCTYNRVKDMDMGFRRSTESPPQLLATSSHDNNYLEETFSILWLWSLYFAIIYFNICFYFPTKISVQLNCMPEQATGFCLVYFFILLILSVTFQIIVTCIAFQILFWPNSLNEICNLCSEFYQVETSLVLIEWQEKKDNFPKQMAMLHGCTNVDNLNNVIFCFRYKSKWHKNRTRFHV